MQDSHTRTRHTPQYYIYKSAGSCVVMWFEFPTMLILSTTDVWRGERFKRRSTTKAAATGQARHIIITSLSPYDARLAAAE